MTLLIGLIIAGIVMLLVEIFCSDGRIYLRYLSYEGTMH